MGGLATITTMHDRKTTSDDDAPSTKSNEHRSGANATPNGAVAPPLARTEYGGRIAGPHSALIEAREDGGAR